jgi:hypothetical protein
LIGSFLMDSHRSRILRNEFDFGRIEVVVEAERIRVDDPKNQGFAKFRHTLPIQIPLGTCIERKQCQR